MRHSAFDVLVETLADHGVETVFGIPGDAINGLVDAIRRSDRVRFVQVRHEESGAMAASAQAELTGKLGVCAGTAGQACRTALTRRTVAHLSVPMDIGSHSAGRRTPPTDPRIEMPRSVPPEADLQRAARLLDQADRVAVLAGIGATAAEGQLLDLLDKLQAPFIKTLRSKDLLHDGHPACLGFLGLIGMEPALKAVQDCDLRFMIGTDFPYEDFCPEGKTVIQLDVDPDHLGRRCPIDAGLAGDGGFSMLMGDFLTAVKYELPITTVIFDNQRLGLIQMEQEASGLPEHKTGLQEMNYAEFARICGGRGARVETIEELEIALQNAYASDEPWVVDVRISGDERTMPPRIEARTALN